MGFDDTEHPRGSDGKFIDTGGQKLKAWSKGRSKPEGFTSGTAAPQELIDGVKKWVNLSDKEAKGTGSSSDTLRKELRAKFGDEAFRLEASKQLGVDVKHPQAQGQIFGSKFDREKQRYPTGPLPGGVHNDRDRITDVRTKEEQPKKGTSDWAPPELVRSPQELFHKFGDEKEIASFEKSPVLAAAMEKEKTIGRFKEQEDRLREKQGKISDALDEAQSRMAQAENLPADGEERAKFWVKATGPEETIPPEAQRYWQWDKDTRWYPNAAQLKNIKEKSAERDRIRDQLSEVRDQRIKNKAAIKSLQESNAERFGELLGSDIHRDATASWVENVTTGMALVMQRAANEMGVKWTGAHAQNADTERDVMGSAIRSGAGGYSKEELKEYMHKQYDLSQASLRLAGYKPGDKITLYRGIQNLPEGSKLGGHLHIDTRPLSSWTDKKTIADGFGTVISAQVPVEQIYSNYRLFKNTYDENEYVVLNGAKLKMKVEAKYK